MWNQIGSQGLLQCSFDRFASFGHNKFTCCFKCSRPPDVDGINIFDKDDQAVKHCSFYLHVLWPGHLYQTFDSINIMRSWAPEITMFCSEFIMTKVCKPIKTRRPWLPIPWLPIWFHIFFSKACFSSWSPLFHTWSVFG